MIALFCLFLVIVGCNTGAKPLDVSAIDRLLANGKLKQASQKIEKYLGQTGLDSLQIKRLLHRRMLVEKDALFSPIEKKLQLGDSSGVHKRLRRTKNYFAKYDTLQRRWFWHDYYYLMSQYKALKKDSVQWLLLGGISLDYPSKKHKLEISLMEDFAFYHARHKKFNKARDWLDRTLRSFRRRSVSGPLLNVYQNYFDGKYKEAYQQLRNIPDSAKTVHWRRIQKFFNLYVDSLTIENRYRLW